MTEEIYDKIEFDDCRFPLRYTIDKRITNEHLGILGLVKWHEELELKLFKRGGAVLQIGTDILNVRSGDVLICNPCDPHSTLEVDAFAEYDVVVFNVGFLANKFDKVEDMQYIKPLLDGRLKFRHLIRDDARLKISLELFFSELSRATKHRQLAITGILLYIFSLLFDKAIDEITDDSMAERAEKVRRIQASVDYINKNYSKNITLEQIAGVSTLTPIYFSKLFKTVMGITVSEYLKTVRLSNAEKLLLSTNEKISYISVACGFEDPCYFNRWFKENNGVTPGEYRNKNK